jgi:ketosteroid isomerase-like protein
VSLAGAQSNDSAAVITAFETARNRHDVDAALSYFADDAQISFRGTVYSGKADMRRFLDTSTRARTAQVTDRVTSGNQITWTERTPIQNTGQTSSAQTRSITGTPTTNGGFVISAEAVVQDGKIRSLTYALGAAAARSDVALEGRAQLPAVAGLGAVLLIVFGVVVGSSMRVRSASPAPSTLRGKLMSDLRGWSAARQSS